MAMGPDVVLEEDVWVHESAQLYGRIRLCTGASVWPHVVARAELHEIVVGPYSNLQDFVMLHIGDDTPTVIGSHCSIGHRATLHGCTIGDCTLVGIGATVMDGARVGRNCIIGPHSLVREGEVIPDNCIAVGTPTRVVRMRNNYVRNKLNATIYHLNARAYARGEFRAWDSAEFKKLLQDRTADYEAELAALESAPQE